MWISSLFQIGMRKLFILGLVSSLAACGGGGGGGGGTKASQAPASVAPLNSSSVSSVSSSSSSLADVVSSLNNSTISSQDNLSSSPMSSAASIANSSIDFPGSSSSSLIGGLNPIASSSMSSPGSSVSSSSTSSIAADTTPDAFSFPAVTGAALSANVTSAVITISGIDAASPITITGGKYSIAGGTATDANGTVTNGQTVVVSLTTSATPSTTTQATLTVGGVAQTFSVTTELPDTTPDVFSFTAVITASLNAAITSNPVSVVGINTAVPISITNGEYSINGGAFTSVAGTVSNGQTLLVKTISSASIDSTTQAVVTVGGTAYSFSVSTINPQLGGAIQGTPLNIAGVVTTIAGVATDADGIGTAARFDSPHDTVIVGAYLYIADTWNHKIRKIEMVTGVVTTLAGNGSWGNVDGPGAAASFEGPVGITTDGTHIYVVDSSSYKIRKIEIATGVVTTLAGSGSRGSADGTGLAASFNDPEGITTDGIHLYVADSANHKIRKIEIATGVVTTLAGSGSSGSADGIGAAASFYYPRGITTDGAHLYVADSQNKKIRKIDIATGVVTTLAGSGSSGSADGIGAAAKFSYPAGITTDGTHLYVADSANHKIRKIEIATGLVTTLAGSGSSGSADGTGTAAGFYWPRGPSTDGTHLYVADSQNKKIRKIDIVTGVVTTLAGSSNHSTDGTGAAASFREPAAVTTDGEHLYVADSANYKIRKIEIATGIVTTLAGSGSSGSADGTGAVASFWGPRGITTDGTHLYVADTSNDKIRKIEIATGMVTTLAGSGLSGSADGTGLAASFNEPEGITTDGAHLYVSDSANHKIRKIEISTGVVTTLAGSGSVGSADGTGAAANFYYPAGITTDSTHLYVADSYNNKIRKIAIVTGVVTTLVGSGSGGSADGTGAAASFNYPSGITTDGTHLYVTDSGSIRKIDIATGLVTTLAGNALEGSDDGVGTAAKFKYPAGVTTDGFALFVTDTDNDTIRKIE